MEWKARAGGTAERVWWQSISPVIGTPTLAISDGTAPALSPLWSETAVDAVSDDLRTLTLTSGHGLGVKGAPSRGEAWLLTDTDGAFPVHVGRVTDAEVVLTEALPRLVSLGGNTAAIQAAWWTAELDASTTATAARNHTWVVSYTEGHGDIPTAPMTDEGLLHVVRQPFRTGLRHQRLLHLVPELAQLTHRRNQSLDPLIDAAEGALVAVIRGELHERGLWEDDVDGRHLELAHAYMAAGLLVEVSDPDRGDALMLRGKRLALEQARTLWVDSDRDGTPDDGETSSLSRGDDAGAETEAVTTTTSTAFRYVIGMRH